MLCQLGSSSAHTLLLGWSAVGEGRDVVGTALSEENSDLGTGMYLESCR